MDLRPTPPTHPHFPPHPTPPWEEREGREGARGVGLPFRWLNCTPPAQKCATTQNSNSKPRPLSTLRVPRLKPPHSVQAMA